MILKYKNKYIFNVFLLVLISLFLVHKDINNCIIYNYNEFKYKRTDMFNL